ncbi:MAG: hypothetical protein RLZZ599_395 [Bacteroidota bacterium]|jgi:hypothetical protein
MKKVQWFAAAVVAVAMTACAAPEEEAETVVDEPAVEEVMEEVAEEADSTAEEATEEVAEEVTEESHEGHEH